MINTYYRYKISAVFTYDDVVIEMPSESIQMLTTNYDYNAYNMPIYYVDFRLNSNLYDMMVLNSETGKIVLTMRKYDNSTVRALNRKIVEQEFSYIMPTDADYHRPLDKLEVANDKSDDSYKVGTMALIGYNNFEENSVLYNDIIKNSNMISIVHKYTSHMNMVIEPFTNNEMIDWIIIPPLTSITNLLKFLNDFQPFYDKGYRYFRDFGKTYLLSNSGNPVPDGNDKYNTVVINILDTSDPVSKSIGIDIDKERKAYVMTVDSLDTHMDIDIVRNKEYNTILGIGNSGQTYTATLNIKGESDKEKLLLYRTFDDEDPQYKVNNMKTEIDGSSVVLQLTRTEIDSSIITPNKEYIVQNYREFQEYNGRYILVSKKEVYIQQENEFVSNTLLVFKKVWGDTYR